MYFANGYQFSYHNHPQKTAGSRNAMGWATLGDIGRLYAEGYLYLVDRKSFLIISGGVNIHPQEIEDAILSHPKVADVAVIGAPNEDFGESSRYALRRAAASPSKHSGRSPAQRAPARSPSGDARRERADRPAHQPTARPAPARSNPPDAQEAVQARSAPDRSSEPNYPHSPCRGGSGLDCREKGSRRKTPSASAAGQTDRRDSLAETMFTSETGSKLKTR